MALPTSACMNKTVHDHRGMICSHCTGADQHLVLRIARMFVVAPALVSVSCWPVLPIITAMIEGRTSRMAAVIGESAVRVGSRVCEQASSLNLVSIAKRYLSFRLVSMQDTMVTEALREGDNAGDSSAPQRRSRKPGFCTMEPSRGHTESNAQNGAHLASVYHVHSRSRS